MANKKKAKALLVIILSVLSLSLSLGSISVKGEPELGLISIEVDSLFYIKGETISINVKSEPNTNYILSVIDPQKAIVYQKNHITNSKGKNLVLLPIGQNLVVGTYMVIAKASVGVATTLITLLETTGYSPKTFPYIRTHKGVNYTINARGFQAKSSTGNLTIKYPSLPISFSVSTFSNSMVFVERLKNIQLGTYIDISYMFIHNGLKIRFNGSIPVPTKYTFVFQSPREVVKKLYSIRDGLLIFDWSDIKKIGGIFNYDITEKKLTVNIPVSFDIDPTIFEDGFETGDLSAWTGSEVGTGDSIAVTTTDKYAGTYSANATVDASSTNYAQVYQTITAQTTLFTRVYARFLDPPSADWSKTRIIEFWGSSSLSSVELTHSTGSNYYWNLNYYNGTTLSSKNNYPSGEFVLNSNVWSYIELKTVVDVSSGEYRVYINGTETLTVTNVNSTNAGNNLTEVKVGIIQGSSVEAMTTLIDNVIIDSSYIGGNSAPTIGGFQAPSTVYANQYFFLNASVNDVDGIDEIVNATISIDSSIILKWDNATATFSEETDSNGYVTLDTSTSVESETNSTAFKLSWNITINKLPAGSIDILVANTKTWDASTSGSGSQSGIFTFSYVALTLQARDKDGTNFPRAVTFTGTYSNGTSLSLVSDANGQVSVTDVTYGSTSITGVTWGTHSILASTSSFMLTGDTTQNINTRVSRLDSGSSYVLVSVDQTTTGTPTIIGSPDWQLLDTTGSGNKEFKADVANWVDTSNPKSLTITGSRYQTGWSWDNTNKLITYTLDFASAPGGSINIEVSWKVESTSGSGSTTVTVTGTETDSSVVPDTIVPYVIPEMQFNGTISADQSNVGIVVFLSVSGVIVGSIYFIYWSQSNKNLWDKPSIKIPSFSRKKSKAPNYGKNKKRSSNPGYNKKIKKPNKKDWKK